MQYQKKIAPDGTEYVAVTYEAVVNVGQLRANLARFRAEEALAHQRVVETEAMIAEVEKVAPELLAAADQVS